MIEVVRKRLAKGPASAGELWTLVELQGGKRDTLKSSLFKGKERGEFTLKDGLYALKPATVTKAKKPAKPKPAKVVAPKVVVREPETLPLPLEVKEPKRLAFKKPDPETTKAPPAGEGKQG